MKERLALLALVAWHHGCSSADESAPLGRGSMALATCSTSVGSGVTGTNAVRLSLHPDLRTATFGAYAAQVTTALNTAGVPATIPALASQSAGYRARLLQKVVHAAHLLPTLTVTINVPGACDFDFSAYGADPNLPAETQPGLSGVLDSMMLPKIHINRSNLALEGDPAALVGDDRPLLRYSGPGHDGVNHGRVLVMVSSGKAAVSVSGLRLQGDHGWSHAADAHYYAHENDSALVPAPLDPIDRRAWHGLVMVGLAGGSNGVRLEKLAISQPSMAGVSLIGNAVVKDVDVTGILPTRETTPSTIDTDIAYLVDELTNPNHLRYQWTSQPAPALGYGFDSGIAQQGDYGAVTVEHCHLKQVLEGVASGGMGSATNWTITNNTFDTIGDHGVYLLGGNISTSTIDHNSFSAVRHFGIKIGGDCSAASGSVQVEPWVFNGTACGPRRVHITANTFELMRAGSVLLSGMFNTIDLNVVTPYSTAADSSPTDVYNPATNPSNVIPDFWIGTDGGQCAYANHAAFNDVVSNSKAGGSVSVLITQPERDMACSGKTNEQADRSVAFNRVDGAGHAVYFNTRAASKYAPIISVKNGATLAAGAPPQCSDCQPLNAAYRRLLTDLNPQPTLLEPIVRGASPGVLMRFGSSSSTFLLGEDGIHARLGGYDNGLIIHGVADLNNNGVDEIYYSAGLANKFMGFDPGLDSAALSGLIGSWEYAPMPPAKAASGRLAPGTAYPTVLVSAYAGDSALYGTTLSTGWPTRGPSIGSGPSGSNAVAMRAADLSVLGESGVAADEMYVGFANGKIVGVYRNGSTFAQQTVYELSGWMPQIALMEPGRVRRSSTSCTSPEAKQRMYHRFAGSPIIYEGPPDTGTALPGMGTGSYFYNGSLQADLLVAADLDGDGRQEVHSHLGTETILHYGRHETCGASTVTWNSGTTYAAAGTPTALRRIVTGGHERLLTLFQWSRTVYLSEGFADNGYDYMEWIDNIQWSR